MTGLEPHSLHDDLQTKSFIIETMHLILGKLHLEILCFEHCKLWAMYVSATVCNSLLGSNQSKDLIGKSYILNLKSYIRFASNL